MVKILRGTVAVGLWLGAAAAFAAPGETELVSQIYGAPIVVKDPEGGSRIGRDRSISADGRFTAFVSGAPNFVSGDANQTDDVFVYDRSNGVTTRVSNASGGAAADGPSDGASISADGRYVAFSSRATDLVAGDTNGASDIFLHDRNSGATIRVSIAAGGIQGNGDSTSPSISADARYVAFVSLARNLVSGDTNNVADIFVHDRSAGSLARVSRGISGAQANGASGEPTISADGRFVAFESLASNLVGGDTNARQDVFVGDRVAGTTERASVGSAGAQANGVSFDPSLSGDGRYVAFMSSASLVGDDTNGTFDVFVRDRTAGATTRVSRASSGAQVVGSSTDPSISADGRHVAFLSGAPTLVDGDTNEAFDVFVHDRTTAETTRVDVASDGTQANVSASHPAISADGRFVVYGSEATNLIANDTNSFPDVFIHERASGVNERIELQSAFLRYSANDFSEIQTPTSVSADGRHVAFQSPASNLVADDTNGHLDAFVRDRRTGMNIRVSVDSAGGEADGDSIGPVISADGRFVAFYSFADDLVSGDTNGMLDVFVHDLSSGATSRVSLDNAGGQATNHSLGASISADGRFVAFATVAPLVSGDTNATTDVYVRDRQAGTTSLASLANGGGGAIGGASFSPSISADGRYVAFLSRATNLVTGDTNEATDVFVHDRDTRSTVRASVAGNGMQANGESLLSAISADGRHVAFESGATNLVTGDTSIASDIFVRDLDGGATERVSVHTNGAEANSVSSFPSISADGRFVTFYSIASNLADRDGNETYDVFLRDRQAGTTTLVSVDPAGNAGDNSSNVASISATGAFIAFRSSATNLTPSTPDTNRANDVYLRELAPRADGDAFQQDARGLVSIEAEHYHSSLPGPRFGPWTISAYRSASGGEAISADPRPGRTETAADAPRAEYLVSFARTGAHYVWLRVRSFSAQSDELNVALDGGPLRLLKIAPDHGRWVWRRLPARIGVPSTGVHTVKIYRLERQTEVDKILMTPNGSFVPAGAGPPESPRSAPPVP